MDQILGELVNNEDDIEVLANIELCEPAIKTYVHYYLKTYYPKRYEQVELLKKIPKGCLNPKSIAYIPKASAELRIDKYVVKFAMLDAIPAQLVIEDEFLRDEIKKMQVTLSSMIIWAWHKISESWELPNDLVMKLHEDGKIVLESNGDPDVFIKCRKSAKFLYAQVLEVSDVMDVMDK